MTESKPGDTLAKGEKPVVLSLREAILRRPGMYLGNIGTSDAPTGVVVALVGNAVFDRGAGRVQVTLHEAGGLTVEDDGRALTQNDVLCFKPPDPLRPRYYGMDEYVIATAASALEIHTPQGRLSLRHGEPVGEPEPTPPPNGGWLTVTLDEEMLRGSIRPDFFALNGLLRDFAATRPGVSLSVSHWALGSRTYHYPRGLSDLLLEAGPRRSRRHGRPVAFEAQANGRRLACAIEFYYTGPRWSCSFVNHMRSVSGGAHLNGALRALRDLSGKPSVRCRSGLALAVAIWDPEARWAGCVAEELIGRETRDWVYECMMAQRDAIIDAANGQD